MEIIPLARPVASDGFKRPIIDPLGDDAPADEVVLTTRRAIGRVALLAAETATRFERERIPYEPMSWMLSPRELFAGAAPIDACLDLNACMRGVMMHALSLGLDADPAEVDQLGLDYADCLDDVDVEADDACVVDGRAGSDVELRLFTATIVAHDGVETVHAFHASLASEEAEVAGRLYVRMGAACADARIVDGFDADDPLVAALVSPAICDTLALVAAEPTSPLAAGFDLNIEQRFLN